MNEKYVQKYMRLYPLFSKGYSRKKKLQKHKKEK